MKNISNWYVITGGPSSGKTTLINELSKLGFHIIPETARLIIDKERTEGKSVRELHQDIVNFQRRILKARIKMEAQAPKDKIVFFDRGIPDCLAYYKLLEMGKKGMGEKEILKFCKNKKYRKIFLLERLKLEKNNVRFEDDELANKVSSLLYEIYSELGYEVIRIPSMSIGDRLKFILSHL